MPDTWVSHGWSLEKLAMVYSRVPTVQLYSKSMTGQTRVVNSARGISYDFSEAELYQLDHER